MIYFRIVLYKSISYYSFVGKKFLSCIRIHPKIWLGLLDQNIQFSVKKKYLIDKIWS